MNKLLSYIPFFGVLSLDLCIIYAYALTGSIGFLPLITVGIYALILTIELIRE
jgi:uncharacterized membrane protein